MLIWLQNPPKTLPPPLSFTPPPSSTYTTCSIPLKKPTKTPFKSLRTPTHPTTTTTSNDSGLKFREKLLYIESLKVNPAKSLHLNPHIRSATLDTIKSVTACLASMGIEPSEIGRILDMFPQLLTSNLYKDIYPVFDFLLNDVGLPFCHIRKSINKCPRILVSDVETQLKPTLQFLKELGFQRITYQTTLLLVYNVELTFKTKIEYFMSLGFERDDVVTMVLRLPRLLTYSIEKNFQPKVDYLLNEMNGDIVELKEFPQYFAFSLEGKIKPRHRLLVEHGFSLSLSDMLMVSDGEFRARLVEMLLQLLED